MAEAKPFSISEATSVWEAYTAGQGQPGRGRCGWRVDRGVREGSEEQPLQGLESDVVGLVLPAAGAAGRDTEGRRRHAAARHSDGGRSRRPDGGQDGAWSRWWSRISTRTRMGIGPGSRRSTPWVGAGAVLARRLGDRSGHQRLF